MEQNAERSPRLGRYHVGRLLGRGGAGQVHLAWHPMPGGALRYVALKLLNGEGDLQREARLGGVLRHRNLVDVYEVGQLDGQAFCAMELCEGGALSAHAPLSARAAVEACATTWWPVACRWITTSR